MDQKQVNYQRIAQAIEWISQDPTRSFSLEDLASEMQLSPFHFHRIFTEWAGTSPKKFIQYLKLQHAKRLLQSPEKTLFDVSFESGLSSTSRLHDLFVQIEGMTPFEYKNGGENLVIRYQTASTLFGTLLLASTEKGMCFISFIEEEKEDLKLLFDQFPNATFRKEIDLHQTTALRFFHQDFSQLETVKLHLKGTPFQLKVWEALLKIPSGALSTYGVIAEKTGNPKASRAVGTAIGNNPIAFLIPCHRVIQSSGMISGYRWGVTRKKAMIAWESAQIKSNSEDEIV